MIRLLRRLGRYPAGCVTDDFDAAAEAAFVADGTAEPVEEARAAAADYGALPRAELLRIAGERGLHIPARAAKRSLVEALEASDDA